MRPRLGFNPIKPVKLAGIRIEPPPSLAPAIGTMPPATAAAAPPLDPPALRFRSYGLFAEPQSCGSVIFLKPNSGVFVRPTMIKPAASRRFTKLSVRFTGIPFKSLLPALDGSPA